MIRIKVEFNAGDTIDYAAASAISLAKKTDAAVTFRFNDVEIVVGRNADSKRVVAEYHNALRRKSPNGGFVSVLL